MEKKMFCFQCEQTAGCRACTGAAGVCGKTSDIAKLQDKLTGALIGLARSIDGNEHLRTQEIDQLVIESLFATLTNVNFDEESLNKLLERVHEAKEYLVPDCSKCVNACGRNDDYDLELLWEEQEDTRSLKSLILFGIRGLAAYAYHAEVLGYRDKEISEFIYRALFAIGIEWEVEALLPIVLEVGKVNLKCMELLDKANTENFGTPTPTEVSLNIEKGPFIVISGHDLYDLKYRFNDLDLGTIGGLPRLMDMGQCNDAYSAIKVATALAEVFECSVNELPLSIILSWYEQKAVCILLTLLYLGIKNIKIGPSLPAFISANVLKFMADNYQISLISSAEKDL